MRFVLNKDKVTLEGYFDTNVSGTIKYYEIPIEYDETWENLVIKAIIVNEDKDTGEEISVINNKFFIDKEKSGTYRVGFVGYTIENEQKVYQVSTDLISFIIDKGAGEIEGVESHDIPTPSEWEIYIAQIQSMVDGLEEQVPTKLSQLQNDNHTVQDENYVHTDNNFSNEDKDKLDGLENYDDTKIKDDIQEINGDIEEINTNLSNYSLITETGSKIDLEINPSTYELVAKLYDKNNILISTSRKIDLPIESMVVSGFYDSVNKKIILTLDNGNTIDIPIGDLISGLQTEITSENKLQSDLVDDTNQNNKFVTTQEKETWNEKYYKPNGGIPKTDLSSEVQESLDKADTAIQESDLEASQAIQDEKITAIEKQIPTGEVNDTSITLTDSADYKVKEFGIEGNTEQETRSGKNLLNPNNLVVASPFVSMDNNNVLTVEINSTGYFKTAFDNLNLPADIYTVYCEILSGTYTGGNLCFFDLNDTQISSEFNFKNSTTHFRTVDCTNGLNQLKFYQPYCSEETKIKLWIAKGEYTTMPPFEPYGAMPSPDYPSPVNTITGDVEVKVQNENLLPLKEKTGTFQGIDYVVTKTDVTLNGTGTSGKYPWIIITAENVYFQNGTPSASDIINKANGKVLSVGQVIQSVTKLGGSTDFSYATGNIYDNTGIANNSPTDNTQIIAYGFYLGNGKTFNNLKLGFQLEKGSTFSTYTPHQEQNYPISLGDIELCKIGDYQDKIFKAINGNTVYDSLTSEQKAGLTYGNWYKYGAVGKHIFDGTENWSLNAERTTSDGRTYLQFVVSKNILTNPKLNANIVCNYFRQSNATAYGFNNVYIGYSNFNICIDKNVVTSLTEFKTWLSTHNVIIIYELDSPTITQITDTTLINQLNALEQAYTYKGVTHIDTDVETKPYLKVVYRKDIGLILERIENLEARVSLLE